MNSRAYKISLAVAVWCAIAMICLYQARALTGSTVLTVSATATATPGAFATPVALASPVVVVAAGQHLKNLAGTNVGTHTPAGNGSTDDTAALNDATGLGDVLVLGNAECTGSGTFTSGSGAYAVSGTNSCCTGSGTGTCNPSAGYFINTITNGSHLSDVQLPNNRNFRCGNGTGTDTASVYFLYTPGQSEQAFDMTGAGTMFGCGWRGTNYNVASKPSDGAGDNEVFIGSYSGTTWQVSNNDFNGIGGDIAAIQAYGNATITYNHAEHCGYYSIQTSGNGGNTVTIDHETDLDCSCCVEGTFTSAPTITMSNGSSTFTHGVGTPWSWVGMAGESGSNVNCDFSHSSISTWSCGGTFGPSGPYPAIDTVAGTSCPTYSVSGITVSGTCTKCTTGC